MPPPASPLRFAFNLDRRRLAQCFAEQTIDAIARLVRLEREVPETLTDDWLLPRLAGVDGFDGRPFQNEVTQDSLSRMG